MRSLLDRMTLMRVAAGYSVAAGALLMLGMAAHLAAVTIARAREPWDFRSYSLVLFGAVGFRLGLECVRAGRRLVGKHPFAIRPALRASLGIVALFAPAIPLSPAPAAAVTALALGNLAILAAAAVNPGGSTRVSDTIRTFAARIWHPTASPDGTSSLARS